MTPIRLLLPSMACVLACAMPAQAQSLIELYEAARNHDASYQAARAQREATLHRAEQSKALLLPSVSLSAGGSLTHSSTETTPDGGSAVESESDVTSLSGSVNLNQPLFRPANTASYKQGMQQVDLAEAQWQTAEHELILRVSQAYFDVLVAEESLTFVRAQKTAVAEQLASARRNFEVGTATITDTREAQARYDLVIAQEIAAESDLRVKKLALDQVVGRPDAKPLPLGTLNLPPLQPADVEHWVRLAQEQSPLVRQARIALASAKLETDKAQAAQLPTVDLTASGSYTYRSGDLATSVTGKATSPSVSAGVQLVMPLFSGYAIQGRLRETLALETKAEADLEAALRTVAQNTRAAYYGLVSGLSQVRALQAAEASSQSALDANKLGYQVGVRINIDVLNSQSQLFQTKRDLASARYNALLASLRLRQASGVLKSDDLQGINALLAPAR